MTAKERELDVRGPFSLEQALNFLRMSPLWSAEVYEDRYRYAHLIGEGPRVVELSDSPERGLLLSVMGADVSDGEMDEAEALVRRMFSLNEDATEFYLTVAGADPVLADLQAELPGLRPVLFATPFEALCWAIITQRVTFPQARRMWGCILDRYGVAVEHEGQQYQAFPQPEHLAGLNPEDAETWPGLQMQKVERLRAPALRGLDGDFDPWRLREMPAEESRAWLERSPGVGAWASLFVLIRGVGHPDVVPNERQFLDAVQDLYDLPYRPSQAEVEQIAEGWRPFRSWGAFLVRVAYRMQRS